MTRMYRSHASPQLHRLIWTRYYMLLGIKVLRMLDEIESYLRLPPFVFRMSRLFFIIFYSVHITCCTFWLIKVSMLHVTYPSIHPSMIDGAVYVLGLRKNKCPSRCPRTQTTRPHPLSTRSTYTCTNLPRPVARQGVHEPRRGGHGVVGRAAAGRGREGLVAVSSVHCVLLLHQHHLLHRGLRGYLGGEHRWFFCLSYTILCSLAIECVLLL